MYKNFMSIGSGSVSSLQPPKLAPFTTSTTTPPTTPKTDSFSNVNKWVSGVLDWGQAGAGIYSSFKQIENMKGQPSQPTQPAVQYVPQQPTQFQLQQPVEKEKGEMNYIPFAIGGSVIVGLVLILVLKKK